MRAVPLLLLAAAAGCTGSRTEAAPSSSAATRAPSIEINAVGSDALCLTRGELAKGASIEVPTMRGYALGAGGDAAQLVFTYRGESPGSRALASGDVRRQIGLKLRAQDGCNVIYVMWRLDPRPKLDVSVKLNPGQTTHEQCGADGYTKVRTRTKYFVPAFEHGSTHTLRAEITGDEIFAWVDGRLAFHGRLPNGARTIAGPAGLRSDNTAFDLVELAAPRPAAVPTTAVCTRDGAPD